MERESKRRKLNSSNENNPVTIFGHGCKGLFLTCDRNKESLAVKETYRLLEQYIELLKDDEESDHSTNEENDIDKEIAELNKKDKPKMFTRLDLGMKGIVFIRLLTDLVHPIDFVKHIFSEIKTTGIVPARYVARIIPIDYTCYAHVEDALKILETEIPKVFNKENEGKSWFCQIKRRNNDSFDKEALIQGISPLIDETKFPVCLRGGDICVHVDVDKGVCGIAIITEYSTLNELSLRTALEPKKEKKPKEEKQVNNVNAKDQDWKCGSCGAPNFKQNDICWKCKFDRRTV